MSEKFDLLRTPALWLAFVLAAAVIAILTLSRTSGDAAASELAVVEAPTCRHGTAVIARFDDSVRWMDTLGAGWYLDFNATQYYGSRPANGAEYVAMLRVEQDRNGLDFLPTYTFNHTLDENDLGQIIAANPGRLWLIGNEIEVDSAAGDSIFPAVYARAYHDAYHYIKSQDPTAQVGSGALSMITPGRLQYLDIVWDTYRSLYGVDMPVDVWNMHIYILSEGKPFGNGIGDGKIALGTDPSLAKMAPLGNDPSQCPLDEVYCRAEHDSLTIFMEQVQAMRRWMRDHGQRNKPLILSELGLLYGYNTAGQCVVRDEFGQCFTQERAAHYLDAIYAYLEGARDPELGHPHDDGRLVQQWLWYSLYNDLHYSGGPSSLLRGDYRSHTTGSESAYSVVGNALDWVIASSEKGVNLSVFDAATVAITVEPGETADVLLQASFTNNGTSATDRPYRITYYRDAALTQVIGSQVMNATVPGCARELGQTALTWRNLPAGKHDYWVKIDSANEISGELDETGDNVTRGRVEIIEDGVEVETPAIFVPLVTRR